MADELADLFASFQPFRDRPSKYRTDPVDYGWKFDGYTKGVAPAEKYTRWMRPKGDMAEQQVKMYVWPTTGRLPPATVHCLAAGIIVYCILEAVSPLGELYPETPACALRPWQERWRRACTTPSRASVHCSVLGRR